MRKDELLNDHIYPIHIKSISQHGIYHCLELSSIWNFRLTKLAEANSLVFSSLIMLLDGFHFPIL